MNAISMHLKGNVCFRGLCTHVKCFKRSLIPIFLVSISFCAPLLFASITIDEEVVLRYEHDLGCGLNMCCKDAYIYKGGLVVRWPGAQDDVGGLRGALVEYYIRIISTTIVKHLACALIEIGLSYYFIKSVLTQVICSTGPLPDPFASSVAT